MAQPKKAPKKLKIESHPDKDMSLPVEWHMPDDVRTYFVTNTVIQIVQGEFRIGFYEARPPFPVRKGEDKKPLEQRQPVKALGVASISVTPERLRKFVEAFSTQLDRFFPETTKSNLTVRKGDSQ